MTAGVGAESAGEKPAAVLEAAGVRVVFVRSGDRFAHRIEVRDPGSQDWTVAMVSQEGTDEDHWPESPPFQQLHVERRKEGDVVLLVGMAGRSHWSAAVDVGPDGKTLRFDVAVRVQATGEQLGSRYDIRDAVAAARIVATAQEGKGDRAKFRFEPNAAASLPATICWKYTIGL